jgi:hypothetical protein
VCVEAASPEIVPQRKKKKKGENEKWVRQKVTSCIQMDVIPF